MIVLGGGNTFFIIVNFKITESSGVHMCVHVYLILLWRKRWWLMCVCTNEIVSWQMLVVVMGCWKSNTLSPPFHVSLKRKQITTETNTFHIKLFSFLSFQSTFFLNKLKSGKKYQKLNKLDYKGWYKSIS